MEKIAESQARPDPSGAKIKRESGRGASGAKKPRPAESLGSAAKRNAPGAPRPAVRIERQDRRGANMIFGVGADILRVDRVERMLQRHGERFPKRILTPLEWQRWERIRGKKKNPAQYLALSLIHI